MIKCNFLVKIVKGNVGAPFLGGKHFAFEFPWVYVTPWFWPHGIKIVHDVYIVFESWKGAQGQGPAIDLVFCVSSIRVNVDGYSAKSDMLYFWDIM